MLATTIGVFTLETILRIVRFEDDLEAVAERQHFHPKFLPTFTVTEKHARQSAADKVLLKMLQ